MKFCVLPGLLWAALSGHVLAHELQASRATLVLRDNQHLAITFFVDYPAVLHQALAPQMLFHEFALQHSAMPTPIFAAQVLLAQRKLQAGTRLMLRSGKAAPLTLWAWPEAVATQKALQQRAMQAVVGVKDQNEAHTHAAQSEIRAEAQSTGANDMSQIKLQLPVEFKQTLVVSYQPTQTWIDPKKPLQIIRF